MALFSATSAAAPPLLAANVVVPVTLRVALGLSGTWVIAPPVLVALRLLAGTLPSTTAVGMSPPSKLLLLALACELAVELLAELLESFDTNVWVVTLTING